MKNRQDQIRTSPHHIIVKTLSMQNKKKIIESSKKEVTCHKYRETHQNDSKFLPRNSKNKDSILHALNKITPNLDYCI
jgi:translation initiation factor 2 alpha subunit (eIF-2alpha)